MPEAVSSPTTVQLVAVHCEVERIDIPGGGVRWDNIHVAAHEGHDLTVLLARVGDLEISTTLNPREMLDHQWSSVFCRVLPKVVENVIHHQILTWHQTSGGAVLKMLHFRDQKPEEFYVTFLIQFECHLGDVTLVRGRVVQIAIVIGSVLFFDSVSPPGVLGAVNEKRSGVPLD
jgi:hypothetical protein